MTQRFGRVLRIGVSLVLVLAACGGGDDNAGGDDDGNGNNGGTTATNLSTVVPTAIPNIPGLSDECVDVANLMIGATQAFIGSTENLDQLFAGAESSVPSDLRDDVAVIRGAVEDFAAGLEELGFNPFQDPSKFASMTPAQSEQFSQLSGILDRDAVNDAFDAVTEWGEAECPDFDPGG